MQAVSTIRLVGIRSSRYQFTSLLNNSRIGLIPLEFLSGPQYSTRNIITHADPQFNCSRRHDCMAVTDESNLMLGTSRLVGFSRRLLLSRVCGHSLQAAGVLDVHRSKLDELRGHFPDKPILPAVLLLEAMFQVVSTKMLAENELLDVRKVREARFRRPVTDGESILLTVTRKRVEMLAAADITFHAQACLMQEYHGCIATDTLAKTPVGDALFDCNIIPMMATNATGHR